mgnify:CR=1 FL=1
MDKEPITLNGLDKLKEELVFLKEKKRPEIVAAIAEARSHGDLKENAEYQAAKEEQSHSEGRITEINDIIARANVIDVTKLNNDGKINSHIDYWDSMNGLFIKLPFLPIQPNPLFCAQLLSKTGALSTKPLPFISPISSFSSMINCFNLFLITS